MLIPGPTEQSVGSTRTLRREDDGSVVRRSVLANGVRVLTEFVPAAHSVTVGLWIGVGSRDESPKVLGSSHFLEHLLFKGTGRRNAFEISAAIEAVGGDLNAFTTKECTCFHARVLADDLPVATDVLADMVTGSLIAEGDFESERRVVLEELAMREDDPADFAHESFSALAYGRSPLAHPIIGTGETLRAMRRSAVKGHYRRHYRPNALVVTAAGAVDHDQLVSLVSDATRDWRGGDPAEPVPARVLRDRRRPARPAGRCVVKPRPTEQAHIVLGFPGPARRDDRRWSVAVLDVMLGGGMSSRLFQEVREVRGLAYAVGTFRSAYSDAGIFGVRAGTHPDRAAETIAVIREVLAGVAADGPGGDELSRAKGQLRGATILEAEDPAARMFALGKAEVLSGELFGVGELMELIDGVTGEEVAAVAATVFSATDTIAVVGPFEPDQVF